MKDVKGYEGQYAVTSCGKVWSYKSQKFLKPWMNQGGYLLVTLSKGGKTKNHRIHRLVAEAYIPNPEEKPQVNHLDENKQNNSINNLEWATSEENNKYGTRLQRIRKKIYCVELDREFDSLLEAATELGIYQGNISAAARGRIKTTGGYHWRYIE